MNNSQFDFSNTTMRSLLSVGISPNDSDGLIATRIVMVYFVDKETTLRVIGKENVILAHKLYVDSKLNFHYKWLNTEPTWKLKNS